jgi:hypothetical protein
MPLELNFFGGFTGSDYHQNLTTTSYRMMVFIVCLGFFLLIRDGEMAAIF